MKYWLLKTEPNTYSWDDLERDHITTWEGVRNYQARNFIRDEMQAGDLAFIYHSVVKPMAIVGLAEIVKAGYPDHFAFEKGHKYFDPKSKPDNPTWYMVDVQAKLRVEPPITLDRLKEEKALDGMLLLQKGSRLSVQPVSREHFEHICRMANIKMK